MIKAATFAPAAAVPARASVRVVAAADRSRRLGVEERAKITGAVRRSIEQTGHPVADAAADFVVSTTVTEIAIVRRPGTAIACKVAVRVAPAAAGDGERWDAGRTATATGAATATAGGARPAHIARAIDACVLAAAEEVVALRIVPFLERAG